MTLRQSQNEYDQMETWAYVQINKMQSLETVTRVSLLINPFNASCSKLLLFEGFSTILV